MADHMTAAQRSRAMKRVKLRNGSLEKLVQSELRANGYKFRRHVRNLPGKPDIVFPKERVAIFVDGDFWHGYRLPKWEHKLTPFWKNKLWANRCRDSKNFRKLRAKQWKVVRIWQHQLKDNFSDCMERVFLALKNSTQSKANLNIPVVKFK